MRWKDCVLYILYNLCSNGRHTFKGAFIFVWREWRKFQNISKFGVGEKLLPIFYGREMTGLAPPDHLDLAIKTNKQLLSIFV
jgi:hypothetical protein